MNGEKNKMKKNINLKLYRENTTTVNQYIYFINSIINLGYARLRMCYGIHISIDPWIHMSMIILSLER